MSIIVENVHRNSNPSHKVMEGHQKTVLDHQANVSFFFIFIIIFFLFFSQYAIVSKELDNYREAVKRMSNDIVNFHKTIAQLQVKPKLFFNK